MCCEPCKIAALIRWLFTGVSFYKLNIIIADPPCGVGGFLVKFDIIENY